jgi:hypothetical protein
VDVQQYHDGKDGIARVYALWVRTNPASRDEP